MSSTPHRVRGIGGVFLKARDTGALLDWYRTHLGLDIGAGESWMVFRWRRHDRPEEPGTTTWALFDEGSDYLGERGQRFMVNYRVDDLDGMLAQLRAAGVAVDHRVEETSNGRFGWAVDPEGNRIELWQPAAGE